MCRRPLWVEANSGMRVERAAGAPVAAGHEVSALLLAGVDEAHHVVVLLLRDQRALPRTANEDGG